MRVLKLLFLILSLTACAGESQVAADAMRLVFQEQAEDVTLTKRLNPNYQYLRLVQDGRPLLLALGYAEYDKATGTSTDIWYSGLSEVIKIKAGRIVAVTGTPRSDITIRLLGDAKWSRVLSDASNAAIYFNRERDVSINYRFGIKEKVTLQKISKPADHSLVGVDRPNLVWFQESYEPNNLPPSIYAVDASVGIHEDVKVVYSWQCLSNELCLSTQAWGLSDQAAAVAQALKKP
jgi:hypothetical protein